MATLWWRNLGLYHIVHMGMVIFFFKKKINNVLWFCYHDQLLPFITCNASVYMCSLAIKPTLHLYSHPMPHPRWPMHHQNLDDRCIIRRWGGGGRREESFLLQSCWQCIMINKIPSHFWFLIKMLTKSLTDSTQYHYCTWTFSFPPNSMAAMKARTSRTISSPVLLRWPRTFSMAPWLLSALCTSSTFLSCLQIQI